MKWKEELAIFIVIMLWIAWLFLSGNQTPKAQAKPINLKQVTISSYEEPKTIIAEVTKYSAIETCKGSCITASGVYPRSQRTLACPRSIPFGTRVNVEGKWYTCEDRLNIRYDSRFDIYAGASQSDYQEAISFGIKRLPVTIER